MARPVVITGGGTGGHVYPMLAIAEALVAEGIAADELRYVGSRRGQDASILGGASVALTLLPGRGLRRSWRVRDAVRNALASLGLAVAVLVAGGLARRWRPSVVVSLGGYASFAFSIVAVFSRIPLVLVELDATPGAAQRVLARYATTRCCSFPAAGEHVVVTGAPLRPAIERVDRSPAARDAARAALVPAIEPGRQVVVVMSGSLGSARVNAAVRELAELWRARRDVALVHVAGRRDYEELEARRPESEGLDYRLVDFADMIELWSIADVAVCRAGAISVAELTVLGIPSILVPLPGAPGDHQMKNAELLEEGGGALLLRDEFCTGEALATRLEAMMSPWTLDEMSERARRLGHAGGAKAVARAVLSARAGR